MLKKFIRSLLCLLVAVYCIGSVAYAAPDDITGHWSEPYFRSLSAHGVINPNGKGHFTPATAISRAEFMRYINRAFGFTEEADISKYKDVPKNQWYYQSVRIAVKYGYISGLSATQMAPEKEITREQAITILGRLCKINAGTVKPSQLKFSDRAKIATWSAPYIKWGLDNGYIAGYTNNTFQPQRSVTRGEAAKILYFFTGTILNQDGASYNSTSLNRDTKNVTVSTPSSLMGMTVSGNLYLSEGLKQAAVTLDHVTVKGRLVIAGGNVQLNHVQANDLYISSPFTGREIKVTSAGMTSIAQVTTATTAQLIQTNLQAGAEGFQKISVTGDKNTPVTLNGRFADVTLTGKNRMIAAPDAYVQSLTVKGASAIEGSGTIQNAVFAASGSVSAIEPATYSFHKGVSATIKGAKVSTNRTQPNHTLSPSTIQMNAAGDVVFAITSDDKSAVRSVMLADRMLENGTQYVYDGVTGSIRLLAPAFQGLPNGTHTLQVIMSTGVNPTAVIHFSGGTQVPTPENNIPQTNTPQNNIIQDDLRQNLQFSAVAGHVANRDVMISLNIDQSVVVQAVLLENKQLAMPAQYTIMGNQIILKRDALLDLTQGKRGGVTVTMMLSNGKTLSAPISLI